MDNIRNRDVFWFLLKKLFIVMIFSLSLFSFITQRVSIMNMESKLKKIKKEINNKLNEIDKLNFQITKNTRFNIIEKKAIELGMIRGNMNIKNNLALHGKKD